MKKSGEFNRAPNRCRALNKDCTQCRGRSWGTLCRYHSGLAKKTTLWMIDDLAIVTPIFARKDTDE